MRLHRFAGEGDRCSRVVDEAGPCGYEATHPIHRVDVDPLEVTQRQLFGQRRDARDIEVGNPRLVDPER